jgi:hypothetical protein
MTLGEFKAAFEIAKTDVSLTQHDIAVFDGFGLPDFQPVTVTVEQVARLIRYQAQFMSGGWESAALNVIRECGRRKFIVLGAQQ